MRRKAAIALMLALVLFASSLSATAAYSDGFYGGHYYELVGTCEGNEVYARTSVDNRSYIAKVSAKVYRYDSDSSYTTVGPLEKASSISFSMTMEFVPLRMRSYHYINGILITDLLSCNS